MDTQMMKVEIGEGGQRGRETSLQSPLSLIKTFMDLCELDISTHPTKKLNQNVLRNKAKSICKAHAIC